MARGITLKGEAARAFIEGAMGKPIVQPKKLTLDDKYLVIATKVTMLMKSGTKKDATAAVEILKVLARDGVEGTYEIARII